MRRRKPNEKKNKTGKARETMVVESDQILVSD
jgi:hypothetical protein